MKKITFAISFFVLTSTVLVPVKANAWVWFVAKQLIKADTHTKIKPSSRKSNENSYYNQGWSNGDSRTDGEYWKQLQYREKDWNK